MGCGKTKAEAPSDVVKGARPPASKDDKFLLQVDASLSASSANEQAARKTEDPFWEYRRGGVWIEYKKDCQGFIETIYQEFVKGLGRHRRNVDTTDDRGQPLKISLDFTTRTAKVVGRNSALADIRRTPEMEAPLAPKHEASFLVGKTSLGDIDQRLLMQAWRQEPRPSTVQLSDGRVVHGFENLEFDKARCGQDLLRLWLKVPLAGSVSIPAELEKDESQFTDFGSYIQPDFAKLGSEEKQCKICLCDMEPDEEIFKLSCNHIFHGPCLKMWFENKKRCPSCTKSFGKLFGCQPRVGTMSWHTENFMLEGHPQAAQSIVLKFHFPAGVTEKGEPYVQREPFCYLPRDAEGLTLLELYIVAFRRRVMFGFGARLRDGALGATFNIHIKTSKQRGTEGHGYPDETYFKRSLGELRENGVTIADLQLSPVLDNTVLDNSFTNQLHN